MEFRKGVVFPGRRLPFLLLSLGLGVGSPRSETIFLRQFPTLDIAVKFGHQVCLENAFSKATAIWSLFNRL